MWQRKCPSSVGFCPLLNGSQVDGRSDLITITWRKQTSCIVFNVNCVVIDSNSTSDHNDCVSTGRSEQKQNEKYSANIITHSHGKTKNASNLENIKYTSYQNPFSKPFLFRTCKKYCGTMFGEKFANFNEHYNVEFESSLSLQIT